MRVTQQSEEVALFWNTSILLRAGQYRICWCPDYSGCITEADFATDVGRLELVGISPYPQHRTCVTGQTCEFDGMTGLYLTEQDLYLVADTCGTTSGVPRFLGSSSFSTAVTNDGAQVSFGSVPVTAAGGHFMLCWCSGTLGNSTLGNGCSTFADFQVTAGTLSLLGPAPLLQDKTCISGHTCSFEITSHLPHEGNSFLVLDTCGVHSLPPRLPVAPPYQTTMNLSSRQISMAGGQYRLCWCAGKVGAGNLPNMSSEASTSSNETVYSTCSFMDEFNVDFGGLFVMGLAPLQQSKSCVSGYSCVVEGITGYGLSAADGYMILDTCGVHSGPLQTLLPFESQGNVSDGWSVTRRWVSETQVSGGFYRLCWCADHPGNQTSWCQHAEYNTVDFGVMTFIGPELSSVGWTCVSGQTCVVDAIAGNGLSLLDAVMILETCGTALSGVGLVWPATPLEVLTPLNDQGQASWHDPLSAPGGDFRLGPRP